MDKNKTKAYLLFAGLGLIILIPLVFLIYNNIKDSRLYDHGLKINGIVKELDRSRNSRTRTYNYYMTVDFRDTNGKVYSEKITIDYETYRENPVGKSIEILIDKDNPTSITLVDATKYYKTEERVLTPKDLIEFYEDNDIEFILSKLNKISIGWYIDESDSNTFVNPKRQSYIKLRADSITYHGIVSHENDLKQYINALDKTGYGKFDPGYLVDIPFGNIPEPQQKIRGQRVFDKYLFKDYELLLFNQIDYSNKAWVILSAKPN